MGAGRWQRYVKRHFLRLFGQGFRIGLAPSILHTVNHFEQQYGSLTDLSAELIAADDALWGHFEADWDWITLPDGTAYEGSPGLCLLTFKQARAQTAYSTWIMSQPAQTALPSTTADSEE